LGDLASVVLDLMQPALSPRELSRQNRKTNKNDDNAGAGQN
jgi:hypothetical protein